MANVKFHSMMKLENMAVAVICHQTAAYENILFGNIVEIVIVSEISSTK